MWNYRTCKGVGVLAAFAATGIQINKSVNSPEGEQIQQAPNLSCRNETGGRQSSVGRRADSACYQEAIFRSQQLLKRFKEEVGAPGISVGVSVNGRIVWQEGFGYSDLENMVPCTADSVMRIASISKSLTMTAVAKLWEQGQLDMDKPVQQYVPSFPEKTVDGSKVTITLRHLVTNTSGIRHYHKISEKDNEKKEAGNKKDSDEKEFFIKENYATVGDSLVLFKDDPLQFKPGTKFLYTTYGWTLVSAIVEAAAKTPFTDHMTKMLRTLGMNRTYLDVNHVLIPHRSKHYRKDKRGHVVNVPYVDNSYKWAGGGFLSVVADLVRFGNIMLYSHQWRERGSADKVDVTPGFLKRETVEQMWTAAPLIPESRYGMGWVLQSRKQDGGCCNVQRTVVLHTGGAVGASSVLLMLPPDQDRRAPGEGEAPPPRGTVVALITNMQDVGLQKVGLEIAHLFDSC